MKKVNNFKGKNIFFIGIGGISMSGLAKLSISFGAKVSGSDVGENQEIIDLKGLKVSVYDKHSEDNITKDIDLVVYTVAISDKNPELLRAKELGIPIMDRAEFLGIIASNYKNVIAVSGTHGKTTTTAMISEMLISSGAKPTIHLGGESVNLKNNTIIGNNDYLVLEACEYKESFRFLRPTISVITNIELDHVDYYKDYNDIKNAFGRFAGNSEFVIFSTECDIEHSNNEIIFKDWLPSHIEFVSGGYNFIVVYKGNYYGEFRINMLGYHNVINALNAIAVAHKLGISKEIIGNTLSSFMGVERRYETIKEFSNGCRVIIDYAHHPTEIRNSITGIKECYDKVLCVFQPHTYSRTFKLFNEFKEVLEENDEIVIFDTYPAREEKINGGTAYDLYQDLQIDEKFYFDKIDEIIPFLQLKSNKYECILVLGAGDLAYNLKRNYNNV